MVGGQGPIMDYDTITRKIGEYGAYRYAQGHAISEATVTLRAEQASTLLVDITLSLHRLYRSLGEDV